MAAQEENGTVVLKEGETEPRFPIHYSGSSYTGPMKEWRPEGEGEFTFCTGTTYRGSWKDGAMHGVGVTQFPGAGQFRALWKEGKAVGFPEGDFAENPDPYRNACYNDLSEDEKKSLDEFGGRYLFPDNLEHVANMWRYCDGYDRRFYAEALEGDLKPVTQERMTAEDKPREIPDGMYDCGEGFYNPETRMIVDYDTGKYVRYLNQDEHEWVTLQCRRSASMMLQAEKRLFKGKMQARKEAEEKEGMRLNQPS